MKKLSIRKLSILGFVLMAASAVTAAIMPAKSDKKDIKKNYAGSLTLISEIPDDVALPSSLTCEVDTDIAVSPCNVSESYTTAPPNISSNYIDSGCTPEEPNNTTDCE